jgi:hypothetical protein
MCPAMVPICVQGTLVCTVVPPPVAVAAVIIVALIALLRKQPAPT